MTTPIFEISQLPDRLAGKLTEVDGHWLWQGQLNNKGYGLVYWGHPRHPGKPKGKRAAHLVVWEQLIGLVPDGLELDHTCKYKTCANPACLEPVTHAENLRRAGERQLTCRAAGHPRTPENTYRHSKTGGLCCRECQRLRDARRVPRKRNK